jgi:hypothetical protein
MLTTSEETASGDLSRRLTRTRKMSKSQCEEGDAGMISIIPCFTFCVLHEGSGDNLTAEGWKQDERCLAETIDTRAFVTVTRTAHKSAIHSAVSLWGDKSPS